VAGPRVGQPAGGAVVAARLQAAAAVGRTWMMKSRSDHSGTALTV